MKRIFIFVLCLVLTESLLAAKSQPAPNNNSLKGRITVNFNDDWTFQPILKDGIRKTPLNSKKPGDSFEMEKTGESIAVRLPHDWAISGSFDEASKNGGQGKLPWQGVGLYTKTFELGQEAVGKSVIFDFGGCMAFPEVYINGKYAGGWDYGYLGFQIDATPYVKRGAKNTIQVRCDTREHGSRWYPGAGIYRSVRMIFCSKEAWLPQGSVFIQTEKISGKQADLQISVTPERKKDLPLNAIVSFENKENSIKIVKEFPLMSESGRCKISVPDPVLWNVDHPSLYTVSVKLLSGKTVLDEISIPFGIRQIEWTVNDGFHINGKRLQLYGVDLHHDQGILGAASHPAAIERQLRIMKEMGVNAIRTSHNPNSPEFMDACDRLGFIVWNELFDKWNKTADLLNQNEFDEFTDRQVRQFVHRDQNRPSVCVWSIGNEIFDIENNRVGDSNPFNDAARRVKHVADCYRKYDKTRKVALGCCVSGTCANGVRDSVDITGWNYNAQYQKARLVYPNMPLVYSESASAVSTRGYYEIPHPKNKAIYNKKTIQVDGYDFNSVPWGDIPDPEFERMAKDTYCAGEFVWTGFDYLGEPSPFNEQARSSYFGIVDLCGLPKDRYFIYRSYWNPEATTVHILPHWNWENSPVKDIPVYVYTNGESAELFLNGKSLGKKTKIVQFQEPVNLAAAPETKVTASSEEKKDPQGVYNAAGNVLLADPEKKWCASSSDPNQWLSVDLGSEKEFRTWTVRFEQGADRYQYSLLISTNGSDWTELFAQKNFKGTADQTLQFDTPQKARYFKIVFNKCQQGSWASIRTFFLSNEKQSPDKLPAYYQILDKYRLRWENVRYEPGILEAVAYKNGKEIGRSSIQTAGKPAAIRLTPEKKNFRGDDDLCYILAETVDKNGTPCPLDTRSIAVKIDGAAELVGIGNGNPIGYDRITDAKHPLFYGKAMIVLRSCSKTQKVRLSVTAADVKSASVEIGR